MVNEWLQLPRKTTIILNLSYTFASQCKERCQEIRGTDIIIILRHPASSILRLNFADQNVSIEPNNWDVCINFKEARSPQCLDDIIRLFYNIDSWTLVV
jgi:hypothetical protein